MPDKHPTSPIQSLKHLADKVDLGEDIDLVIGVTATALTADQLMKETTSKDHKLSHLAKAGLSAAVAATAFTMMGREHNQRKRLERLNHHGHHHKDRSPSSDRDHDHDHHRRRHRSHSRSPSRSPDPHRRLLLPEDNVDWDRPYRREDWAVVQAPSRSRSPSSGPRRKSYDDLPYPPDSPSRWSSPPRRVRRARSHSPPPHHYPDLERGQRERSYSGSKRAFKKFLEAVQGGLEGYERYNSSRR